jgi:trans-aconitate 2-methyltransferase
MESKSGSGDTSTYWSPGQYQRFGGHRLRPALELLQRVPLESPELVYDLGCGDGYVTRLMAERWPGARITGVDNSNQMLSEASEATTRIKWIASDIGRWKPDAPPDLIYSNAALHWLENHAELFPQLAGSLKPGGCLAVQMPLSWRHPSHRLMRETLANGGPGGGPIGPESLRQTVGRKWVEDPEFYYDLLGRISRELDIWTTEYLQVLDGEDAVLEWVKGTGLRPILNGLEPDDLAVFLAEYSRQLRECYPRRADGRTLYPFGRLFIVATV